MMGQPSPVSNRSAPVRPAISIGTSCLQAYTASTANSGKVCSHARIARANPWAMKNCADSAAQAMSRAANRIQGAVHSRDQGPTSPMGNAASNSSAQTATPVCGLSETDCMASRDNGMFLELRARSRKVGSEVRAPAFLACQRALGDEQSYSMDIPRLEHGQ